jgi:preprotein translocase subunit SecF
MIRFSKYIWLYALLSALVLVPGIYTLTRFGLRQSIDFTGGTLVELETTASPQVVREAGAASSLEVVSLAQSGGDVYVLRMREATSLQVANFVTAVASASGTTPQVLRQETVGPILGSELLTKALTAALIAIIGILLYVAYAFRNIKFGVSAIVALIHDLLVVLGSFAIFGRIWQVEVDTLFVTAILTTMSFSVHDTIVVFDRIREYRKRDATTPLPALADQALTETMNRSLVNSFTIIFMLLTLLLMGGETTKWFVAALLIGTISGTYSSPFVATPVLVLWDVLERKKKT